MAELCEAIDLAVDDLDGLVEFAKSASIDLTVVGPELPLTLGIVDRFRAAGLHAFGPSKAAAQLEGSKAWSKAIMESAGIPTAASGTFEDADEAKAWVQAFARPVVVKADGLAAGKGVIICDDFEDAARAIDEMLLGGAFGQAGRRIVVEERLIGEEVSFIALCDGTTAIPLATSQDHKRIGEGDTGLNTGGMGAYSPAPQVGPEMTKRVMAEVIAPTMAAMRRGGNPFVGFLYAGLMLTESGPKVLEFNVRLGDPETQPLMMRLQSDLPVLMMQAIEGALEGASLTWDSRDAVCVVLASAGYPVSSTKGDVIEGLSDTTKVDSGDTMVFHAGTSRRGDQVLTAGGRVLSVCALGHGLKDAVERAYRVADQIEWPGRQMRRDIAWRALA
jgi:phosphoribosylamine--glycine ligase